MPKVKVIGQTVQTGGHTETNKQADKQTDGRTLPSALSPCFAVVNNRPGSGAEMQGVYLFQVGGLHFPLFIFQPCLNETLAYMSKRHTLV